MAVVEVKCPKCKGKEVIKYGQTTNKKQRYICKNKECKQESFILEYSERAMIPEIKEQIVKMAINGSGIRDTARVLKISPTTVINELKKSSKIEQVNKQLIEQIKDKTKVIVKIEKQNQEAEMDEMWSYVGKKEQQRWLWHAIDHQTNKVLAYTFGNHQDEILVKLKELLKPFEITKFYTDSWGAYQRWVWLF